ncbi:MAG: FecR domain-containing protein [Rhodocyclales bacterium]|nr:FecR domain-containing protein [Rhodocyclales bacterium]
MIRKILGLFLMLVSSVAFAIPAAYVHEMTGSGTAATGSQSRSLAVGGLLESGDVISVAKGTMTLKFEDGQIVVLQENSRFAIEKYNYNKKKVADSNVVLALLSGGMRFVTGVIGGTRKDAIAMRAGTATIGIRGTDLAINIAGVNYVVTVQDGGIVLSLPGQPAASVVQGQGAAGATNQPARPVPVVQLSAAVLAAVAPAVQKAVPGTNPVGVQQQATLVQAVENATKLAEAAKTAPPAEKAAAERAAAAAAQQVQQAVVGALQATQQAIQAAVNAGATSGTATGAPATSGGTGAGVKATVGKSETQQAVDTIKAINVILPAAQKLDAAAITQVETQAAQQQQQQVQQQLQQQPAAPAPTPTAEQQVILNALPTIIVPPPAPPTTCGGAGQSPC